jgi:hypothetical protein
MKILIDLNHPAHVHYFKHFYKIMKEKKHKLFIISRNKEIEHYLLNKYNIPFFDRGKGKNSFSGKILYYFIAIYKIYMQVKMFKPDLIMSFGTPYPAIVGWMTGITHISFTDTEHAKLHHMLTDPFSVSIITPACYNKNLGKKQIPFKGFMELCYLHPNYFNPDPSVLKILRVEEGEKYVIMRFVSWKASHDVGYSGLSYEMKLKSVREISKFAKVFISSEGELPKELKSYQITIPPERMHDVLYYSTMYFGDGGTMASEAALLGAIAVNVATSAVLIGTFAEISKYGLMYVIPNGQEALIKAIELLKNNDIKDKTLKIRRQLLLNNIDVTAFIIWFVENYPSSAKTMKSNPDFQDKFK